MEVSIRIKLNNIDLTCDNEFMHFSKVNEDFKRSFKNLVVQFLIIFISLELE